MQGRRYLKRMYERDADKNVGPHSGGQFADNILPEVKIKQWTKIYGCFIRFCSLTPSFSSLVYQVSLVTGDFVGVGSNENS